MNWLIGIKSLKECGMTLDAIKTYIEQGNSTIETRYHIILKQKETAKCQLEEAKQRLDYMEKKAKLWKTTFLTAPILPNDRKVCPIKQYNPKSERSYVSHT